MSEEICCPKFNPEPWDEKEMQFDEKIFLKDHVISFLHIPLNYGAVMTRSMAKIEKAGVKKESAVMLTDERSLWGADVYIEVTGDVPDAEMAEISGTFLSKVFEGPFSNMGKWIAEMNRFVESRGRKSKKLWFYYTTCPKCAKKYGKNYVVILAEI